MQTKNFTLVIILSLLCLPAHARLELPRVISSNMVLQRDSVSPIWGQDDPGNEVTVSIAGQVKKTKALENGKWVINLDPLKVGGPYEMKISSPNDEVILSNILVGEVWVCSGQSNMEWSVKASNNPGEEISNAKFPAIRLFHVPKKASSFPESDCNASWKECSPENIPNFSAVAYYFGRHLHNELKVPIGLIGSAWGGTRIEPWTPVSGFDAVPSLRGVADKVRRYTDLDQVVDRAQRWAEAVKNAVDEGRRIPSPPQIPKLNHGNPTGLYNGMIAPVVPFSVKGAIWYQGESNVGEGMAYHDKMKALISGWRDVFNNDDLSFYFVQIAPYRYNKGEALPDIWEAQTATLNVPGTGMAVITDVGNVQDIHPRNKQDVGKRLALWALAKDYGKKDVTFSGPLYKSMAVEGNKIRVTFNNTGSGLVSRDGNELSNFTISGPDNKFLPAKAVIDGQDVVVSADAISSPKNVRFGWNELVNPNLSNKEGLPASPFKTDGR